MKKIFKKIPFLVKLYQKIQEQINKLLFIKSNTFFNKELSLINDLILFAPNTAKTFIGLEKEIQTLTILSAKQIFPFLQHLIIQFDKNNTQTITAEEFCNKFNGREASIVIKKYLITSYGPDSRQNYRK